MTSSEFSPSRQINRVLNLWWVVALVTILGGAVGYIFSMLHAPVYEATATFIVTIDLDRFPFGGMKPDLIQYNEDLALNTTQDALLSPPVLQGVITQAKEAGITLAASDLFTSGTIERKQDTWELRFRSPDPRAAQSVVNIWAAIGYQAMLSWQQSGKAPNFVIFQSPSPALIPQQPVLYDRNKLMLAGALIGFIIGISLSSLVSPGSRKSLPAPSG